MVDFQDLLIKAYKLIKEKKFDKAIIIYKDLSERFNKNNGSKNEKIRKDIELLFKELTIYLRINEAYVMAEKGDIVALKLELDYINELRNSIMEDGVPSAKPLLKYADKHYQFFLDVYTYKIGVEEFKELCENVKRLSNERKINDAIKEFSHLLLAYNTLSRFSTFEERLVMYKKIIELLRDIEVKRKLVNVYSNKVIPKKLESSNGKEIFKKITEVVNTKEYSQISEKF